MYAILRPRDPLLADPKVRLGHQISVCSPLGPLLAWLVHSSTYKEYIEGGPGCMREY